MLYDANPLDSGIYRGDVKRNVPHGQGSITYFLDDVYRRKKYTGDWVNGTRSGHGTTVWKNGTDYSGGYYKGWEEGLGTVREDGRIVFEGEFTSGARHGKGVVIRRDGTRLKGTWVKGRLVGRLA